MVYSGDKSVKMAAARPEPRPRGRLVEATYAGPAGARGFKLYLPSGAQGQPLPLVVLLHGCFQSPADLAASTRMTRLAEEQTFLVAYPEQALHANRSKCWNWFRAADQQRGRGEPALLAGLTQRIMELAPVDPRRVYVGGVSAGGAMAAILAATYPDVYAAAGVHSGVAVGAAYSFLASLAVLRRGVPGRPLAAAAPLIVFHGDQDGTVHPANADQLVHQWRQAQTPASGAAPTLIRGRASGGREYTRAVYPDAGGRPYLEQWTVHGAGHAWSGGAPLGLFTDPAGPDASAEMLRFFAQHTLA